MARDKNPAPGALEPSAEPPPPNMVPSSDLGARACEVRGPHRAGNGELGQRLSSARVGQSQARLPVLPGAGRRVRAPPGRGSRAWSPPWRSPSPGWRLQSSGRSAVLVAASRGSGSGSGGPLGRGGAPDWGRGFLVPDSRDGTPVEGRGCPAQSPAHARKSWEGGWGGRWRAAWGEVWGGVRPVLRLPQKRGVSVCLASK